jgi:hypothetical protein
MTDDPTPINARRKRRAQVMLQGAQAAFEGASLALRDRLLWPVEDRLFALDGRGRLTVAGLVASVAAVVAIGGAALLGQGSGGSGGPATEVAAATAPRSASPAPTPEDSPPAPTLHGATPVFSDEESDAGKASTAEAAEVEAAKAAAAPDSGSAATAKISTTPGAGATARASSAAAALEGPPAGPAALAVARRFAQAFVVYETGGEESEVGDAFAATTTPELRKALLERPPRQPAGIEVPKAKVVNVVPAPSHGTVFPVSVSLLRLDVTSELRLELERLKGKRWRVVDVLG